MNGRRTKINVTFGGTDITDSMEQYLKTLSYTDNQEDETDDLQITLHDREGIWRESWIEDMVESSSSMKIGAAIVRKDWNGEDDSVLDCGTFELDSVQMTATEITIKGTSLSYQQPIRQTRKFKAWEDYYLSGIGAEIAGNGGYTLMYEASDDPHFDRVEQYDQSDIDFLSEMCHRNGISLKAFNQMLILFDQQEYEAQSAIKTVTHGDNSYASYTCKAGTADTQYGSCHVCYTDKGGTTYEGTATDEDGDEEQCLEICAQCASNSEAEALAVKLLRLYNKYACTISFVFPGDPDLCAGSNVELSGFGLFDGKYTITTAKHEVRENSGYKTTIDGRKVLAY